MSRTPTPLYCELASLVDAYHRCCKNGNEFATKHEESLAHLVRDFMPHGSGIDNGVTFDIERSTGERLVFTFGYHHMADSGMYDGWTDHTLTVKASLQFGYVLAISGRDRNGVKEYLHDTFHHALGCKVWQSAEAPYAYHSEAYEALPV